ncbi:uncharacterized protein LOC131438945 [Malaya genurostris]|uniref:uncharacterized protein LOC131438945 n=1 Tax=Malaya genurostris TaxID=325434 RepID=UPI0026F3D58C|nr:uncharacterized protein LOC131438945 [Malaya genurostris]
MYYSTPHSTTGKTPTELMYGRNIRTKLPSLTDLSSAVSFTDYRDHDWQLKEKGKMTEDQRRNAKPSTIEIGDQVLVKNVLRRNKLTTTFNPTVMTVMAKQGPRITVQSTDTGKCYKRNSSHLKKISEDTSSPPEDVNLPDFDEHHLATSTESAPNDNYKPIPSVSEEISQSMERSRPRRTIKRPSRFDDCEMEQ